MGQMFILKALLILRWGKAFFDNHPARATPFLGSKMSKTHTFLFMSRDVKSLFAPRDLNRTTVDGRNPAPPGMYKILYIMGETTWCRILSINTRTHNHSSSDVSKLTPEKGDLGNVVHHGCHTTSIYNQLGKVRSVTSTFKSCLGTKKNPKRLELLFVGYPHDL